MSENNEVILARQDERMKLIIEKLNELHNDQREVSNRMGQMFAILSNVENRVKVLEESVSKNEELAEEINNLKYEVAGAKKVIKVIWWTLSGMVAMGLALKNEITKWFN